LRIEHAEALCPRVGVSGTDRPSERLRADGQATAEVRSRSMAESNHAQNEHVVTRDKQSCDIACIRMSGPAPAPGMGRFSRFVITEPEQVNVLDQLSSPYASVV
jgi:hypothetical protein